MAPVTVSTRSGAPEDTAADTRVVGVFEDEKLADPALQRLIELGEAKRALTVIDAISGVSLGRGAQPRRQPLALKSCGPRRYSPRG